jgi:hypothetical protein
VPATILAKLDGKNKTSLARLSLPVILIFIFSIGMQMRCFFGILPEIGRAWVSVDENLYIWSYTNP